MGKLQNNFEPSGRDEKLKWDLHKASLELHKNLKQNRKEKHKKTQGKKLKYAGHLY